MASVNKIILIGNLGNDPQIRIGDHVIANLSLGTSRKWRDKDGNVQQETEWHRICAFGRLAEIIRDYTAKGDPLYVEGRLRTRKYEKDGAERYVTEIIAEQIQLLRSKKDNDENPAQAKPAAQRRDPEPAYDSDVPF